MKRERKTTISHGERTAIIEDAIKYGRHGPGQRVCQGCRQWVDAIWYRTPAGKDLCRACSPKEQQ